MMTQMNMKTDREEEMKERMYRDYLEFLRQSGPSFDWVETLLTVLIMVITIGGFTLNIVNVIRMLVEHKFAYWAAATNIFWATVFLSQWVYFLAERLVWKLRKPL